MDAKFDVFAGGLRQTPEWDYVGSNGIEVDNTERVITINAIGENGISVESGIFSLRLGIGVVYDEEDDSINLDYAPTDDSIDEADETSVMTPAATKAMIDMLGGVEYTAGDGIEISDNNEISATFSQYRGVGGIFIDHDNKHIEPTIYASTGLVKSENMSGAEFSVDSEWFAANVYGEYTEDTSTTDVTANLFPGVNITYTASLASIVINYSDTPTGDNVIAGTEHLEAVIRFTMASTSTAEPFAVLPAIQWVGGTPEIELGKSYIISIKDGLGVCCEVSE